MRELCWPRSAVGAVRELEVAATGRPSRCARKSHLDVPANGRFPATSLDLSMARPGQMQPLTAGSSIAF